MVDVSKLQFLSADEIDKVVAVGSFSIFNGGPSGTSYAGSDSLVQNAIPNPYKKKCMVRYRWKMDSGDWNSMDTIMEYAFRVNATAWGGPISDPIPGTLGAVAIGTNDNQIRFVTVNGHHSDVAYTGTAMSPGPDSFVGYSHTFYFEYALMEID